MKDLVMFSIITFFCCLATLTLFGRAAWTDRKSRLIANRISLAICAVFAVWVVAGYAIEGVLVVPVISHLIAAAATFAVTFALWIAGYFGGGDVKLVTALALWSGLENLAPAILLVTLAGGFMALTLILLSRFLPYTAEIIFGKGDQHDSPADATLIENNFESGNKSPELSKTMNRPSVPYGIAISLGGVWIVLQIIAQHGLA